MTFSTEETHNASTVKWKQQLSDAQWEQPVALCGTGRPCVSYVPLSLFYLQRRIVVEWNFVFTSRRRTPDILYFLPASGSSCTSLRQYDYCKQESSGSLGRPPRRSACCQPLPLPRIWMEICWTERSRWKLFFQHKKRLEKIFLLMARSCGRWEKRERQNHSDMFLVRRPWEPGTLQLKDTHAKIYRIQDLQEYCKYWDAAGPRRENDLTGNLMIINYLKHLFQH